MTFLTDRQTNTGLNKVNIYCIILIFLTHGAYTRVYNNTATIYIIMWKYKVILIFYTKKPIAAKTGKIRSCMKWKRERKILSSIFWTNSLDIDQKSWDFFKTWWCNENRKIHTYYRALQKVLFFPRWDGWNRIDRYIHVIKLLSY